MKPLFSFLLLSLLFTFVFAGLFNCNPPDGTCPGGCVKVAGSYVCCNWDGNIGSCLTGRCYASSNPKSYICQSGYQYENKTSVTLLRKDDGPITRIVQDDDCVNQCNAELADCYIECSLDPNESEGECIQQCLLIYSVCIGQCKTITIDV